MGYTEEQRRLLWLSAAEISADRLHRLLEQRGSACALWEDYGRGIALSANAEANRTLARYHSEAALDAICARIEQKGVHPLFENDEAYPALLRCIDDPPYVVYAMGDVSALSRPSVGVVGTRYPSAYGRNMPLSAYLFAICDHRYRTLWSAERHTPRRVACAPMQSFL